MSINFAIIQSHLTLDMAYLNILELCLEPQEYGSSLLGVCI